MEHITACVMPGDLPFDNLRALFARSLSTWIHRCGRGAWVQTIELERDDAAPDCSSLEEAKHYLAKCEFRPRKARAFLARHDGRRVWVVAATN